MILARSTTELQPTMEVAHPEASKSQLGRVAAHTHTHQATEEQQDRQIDKRAVRWSVCFVWLSASCLAVPPAWMKSWMYGKGRLARGAAAGACFSNNWQESSRSLVQLLCHSSSAPPPPPPTTTNRHLTGWQVYISPLIYSTLPGGSWLLLAAQEV